MKIHTKLKYSINKGLLFIFMLLSITAFSQVVNSGMTTNYDSLETGKIIIGGYLDTYYGYDFSRPSTYDRAYCVSSSRHNEININFAYIDIKYTNEKVRGRIVPGFGTYINSNYSAEKGTLKNLVEASGGVCISQKKNIWVDAGVLGSPYTNETAISKDHLMYTRSLGSEYSPYYLSGVKISYPVNKKLNAYGYIINGWQTIFDVNDPLSFGTQIEYRPTKNILLNWDTYLGYENSSDLPTYKNRYFTDLYAIYDAGKKFTFTSCAYIGLQNLQDSLGVKSNGVWYNANFTGNYKLKKNISLSGRIEYFNDTKSIIISPITSNNGFSSFTGGLCFNVKISNHAMFRIEDRIFYSDQKVYFDRYGKETTLSNLLVGSLAVWF